MSYLYKKQSHENYSLTYMESLGMSEDSIAAILEQKSRASASALSTAKIKRDTARYSPITVDAMTFDADEKAYENITGTIANWDSLLSDPELLSHGLVNGETMVWTLNDNTQVSITKSTLQSVLSALSVRAALLHVEYVKQKA